MADKQISELIQAAQITDADLFVLEQDGTAKKLTGATLLDFLTLSVVNVTVTTLPAGSQATAVYNKATGVLALGIPQGDKGETGETGATGAVGATGPAGPQGETPNIQIGKVSTLPTGMSADASITGTTENPLLNLGLPRGEQGSMWYVQARNPISAGVNVRLGDIWSNSNGYVYRAEYNANGELNFVSTGLTIKGATGETGPAGADGADGVTPHIGDNGNWYIGDTDTGIAAEGQDGVDGTQWFVQADAPQTGVNAGDYWLNTGTGDVYKAAGSSAGNVPINWKATGANLTGPTGATGADGKTPVKGTDYFTTADVNEIAQAAAEKVDLSGKQDKITASGILKGTASGIEAAAAGTDYMAPVAVTAADNGKFLRVVNGAWAAAAVANASGVSF